MRLTPRRQPRTLYHYTSGSGLLGIIRSKAIWATSIRFLNDTKEFSLALELAARVLSERGSHVGNRFELGLYEVLQDGVLHARSADVYVTSFSEHGDQLSQWRGYCPPGNGYAIGVDPAFLLEAGARSSSRFLARCVYDENRQLELVDHLVDDVVRFAGESAVAEAHDRDRTYREAFKLFSALLLTLAPVLKHKMFKEEAEWRLISTGAAFTQGQPEFRVSRSMLVPYFEHKLSGANDDVILREVVVGPTPHPELAENALSALLAQAHVVGATVRCSGIPFRDW